MNKVLSKILGVVIAVCLIGAGYIAGPYLYQAFLKFQNGSVEVDELASMTVDWNSLKQTNPNVCGWVVVPGTDINYPIVSAAEDGNSYWLHRCFDGSTGWLADGGSIFSDEHNSPTLSDKNTIIYGHHMNDGSMFAPLSNFADQSVFDANRTVYILTPTQNYECTTYSLMLVSGSDETVAQVEFKDYSDYLTYIQNQIERSSVVQTDILASDVKQSFMLATCDYTQSNGRAVLCASVVRSVSPIAC